MDFWTIAMLLGGLGLFLYGMKLMSDGLEAMAGDKLRNSLELFTKNRFAAVGVGAGVTAVIQSSSATTVMLVGFINAGLMTLTQALYVGMGANIGTTVTAQIVAFKITKIAPLILFVGVLIMMFVKKRSVRRLGEIIGGLGILFFGMNVMSEAMEPLKTFQPFIDMLATIEEPGIGILAGAGVTAVIQSSSATMGIVQSFAMQDIMTLDSAVYLILGLNIGTCITAILASLGGTKTAKRMALALLLFNIFGVAIFMVLLQLLPIVDWVKSWSPDEPVRQLANFHTFFNVITTVIFIFIPWVLTKLSYIFIRGEDKKLEGRKLEYLVSPLPDSSTMVVGLAIKETERMLRISSNNFSLAVDSFTNKDEKMVNEVYDAEKTVNYLNHEITGVLAGLSGEEIPEGDMGVVTELLHSLMNIERISDIAENIADLAMHRIDAKIKMGKKATHDLVAMKEKVYEGMEYALKAMVERDPESARRALEIENEVDKMEKKAKKSHIKRLKKGECTPAASTVFTDIVTMMEREADHAANIASVIIRDDLRDELLDEMEEEE
ncbi:Na/Pi cotransporter family protein [Christensenellaceae bacterium OttesenSCG-928-K19]|nr:Na/Pi cotransporter family protein [Christensenellaceae bacterium OttesenSCG-928-K19]